MAEISSTVNNDGMRRVSIGAEKTPSPKKGTYQNIPKKPFRSPKKHFHPAVWVTPFCGIRRSRRIKDKVSKQNKGVQLLPVLKFDM